MSKETNWVAVLVAAFFSVPAMIFAVAGHWVDLGIWMGVFVAYVVMSYLCYLQLHVYYEGELKWQRGEDGQMRDSSEARSKRIATLPGLYLAYFCFRDVFRSLRSS